MTTSQGNYKECATCSLYNQTPLPAESNPKGTQRIEMLHMEISYFIEFGKLKYVHHTIDTFLDFQKATTLSSEKANLVITYLLEIIAIMSIPVQLDRQCSCICF